jgi:lipoprotein-anchoring transpeptidase ErfK/SrfK
VRLAALSLLIIGSLLATQGHAQDISTQPLTRADCDRGEMAWNESANVCIADSTGIFRQPLSRLDCDRAGMTWNDGVNVCGAASQAAEAIPEAEVAQPMPESEVADSLSQPLTRFNCDRAGMTWNDAANVCVADSLSQPLTRFNCDRAGMTWNDGANVCVADSLSQPLTRLDCDRAGMTWNDAANVCGAAAQAAEAMPEPQVAQPMPESEVADNLSQPLMRKDCDGAGMTWNDAANVCGAAAQAAKAMAEPQVAQPMPERLDCESAGMSWNDTTNVCGEQSQRSATQPASKGANPVASTILINIDKTKQQMTVFLDGVESYNWPVSTGKAGYSTPSGTFTATSMNEIWYSKEWDNAPMPHAIFFMKDGHAIHGSYEVKNLGKPASHGCVRISPENAATLYALVEKTGLKNTQVVLAGTTAGGEGKVATKTRAKSAHRQASRSSRQHRNYYADTFPQRPRGGGFFRRLFGGP